MSESFAIPAGFEGIVRLFPLPNVVLFPQVLLPLHIFEPRYRQMTADALAGDQLITMTLLKPGWEEDYTGKPALYPVACLGKIIADQQLDDGRCNILLRGLSRARILGEIDQGKLYRSARVQLLEDSPVAVHFAEQRLHTQLTQLMPAWCATLGLPDDQLSKLLDGGLSLGSLCDILGYALPLGVEFKQKLLAELSVEERAVLLLGHLQSQQPPKPAGGADHKFPPDFSSN
jgi:Lon protease-like protein